MYGNKPKTSDKDGKAIEEGWALFDIVSGEQRLHMDVRDGQLVLADASQPHALRWSVVVRRQGSLVTVDNLVGDNRTRLQREQYRNGIDMTQRVQVKRVGGAHPPEEVSIKLFDVLFAAREGREYVDVV